MKALRFTASIAPGELSGLTPPYCPIAPTLWRRNIDEDEPTAEPADRRSPLRKLLLLSLLKSERVCSCSQKKRISVVAQTANDSQMLTTSTGTSENATHAEYASIRLPGAGAMWPRHRPEHLHKHPGRVPKSVSEPRKQTYGLVCSGLVLQNGRHK